MMKQIQLIKNFKNLIKNFTHAAEEEGLWRRTEVSITFMTNDEIQEINATYRGKDQPTDVISFALEEIAEGEIEIIAEKECQLFLGDIIFLLKLQRNKQKNMA